MDRKLDRFFVEYDEIANRLSMARERDFARILRTWFTCLDRGPEIVASEVHRLEALQTWDLVTSHVMKPSRGMVGSGQLDWPGDKDDRLGGQLLLLRKLASGAMQVMQFSFDYFYSGDNNINSNVNEMASLFFLPHSDELRRRLEDVAEDILDTDFHVPASHRVVQLGHNAASFHIAIAALEETLHHLKENNAIDPDDKARVETEIKSGLLGDRALRGAKAAGFQLGMDPRRAVAPLALLEDLPDLGPEPATPGSVFSSLWGRTPPGVEPAVSTPQNPTHEPDGVL